MNWPRSTIYHAKRSNSSWSIWSCKFVVTAVIRLVTLIKYTYKNSHELVSICRSSVDKYSAHNLMNISNLSIVWGASLFTSAVSNAFETGDFLRNNTLVKVLMHKYDDIFIEVDRLIWWFGTRFLYSFHRLHRWKSEQVHTYTKN